MIWGQTHWIFYHVLHIGIGYFFYFQFNLEGFVYSLIPSIITSSSSWIYYKKRKMFIEKDYYPIGGEKEHVLKTLPYKYIQIYIFKVLWYGFVTLVSSSIFFNDDEPTVSSSFLVNDDEPTVSNPSLVIDDKSTFIMSRELQDYLFTVENILESYVEYENKLSDFLTKRTETQFLNNSVELDILSENLWNDRIKFNVKISKITLDEREEDFIDNFFGYVMSLYKTINQLSYIFKTYQKVKEKKIIYDENDYNKDQKLYLKLIEEYQTKGNYVNSLLEKMLIQEPIPFDQKIKN